MLLTIYPTGESINYMYKITPSSCDQINFIRKSGAVLELAKATNKIQKKNKFRRSADLIHTYTYIAIDIDTDRYRQAYRNSYTYVWQVFLQLV